MAKAILNAVLAGIRGRIDGLVFRRQAGQTVISPRPVASGNPGSPAQVAQRERFNRAVAYGRAVSADPDLRELYAGGAGERRSAYIAALTDALRGPVIDELDTSGLRGAAGDPVIVRAHDNVAVTGVTVAVKDAAGATLERGPAVPALGAWTYVTTRSVSSGTTVTVEVTAVDRPGNATSLARAVTL